jgi:uncharacterized membrane protein YkvA (DUF1232 family)
MAGGAGGQRVRGVSALAAWKARARQLKAETFALYLACRDPRVRWYARALAAVVVAYAFSPIDLIPDPIPILGYLDDLVLIPLGIALLLRLIPPPVMADCRAQAKARLVEGQPTNWVAGVIVAIWLFVAGLLIAWVVRLVRG